MVFPVAYITYSWFICPFFATVYSFCGYSHGFYGISYGLYVMSYSIYVMSHLTLEPFSGVAKSAEGREAFMLGCLQGDTDKAGLFHGLLQEIQPQGASYRGTSKVTGRHYIFSMEVSQTPKDWAILLGWVVQQEQEDALVLYPTPTALGTWLSSHVPPTLRSVELCSGLGFMGIGSEWMGTLPGPLVEQSTATCQLLAKFRSDVLNLDVCDTRLPVYLANACQGQRSLVLAGFSCQPWSQFGNGSALLDPRAASFEGVIRTLVTLKPVCHPRERVAMLGRSGSHADHQGTLQGERMELQALQTSSTP